MNQKIGSAGNALACICKIPNSNLDYCDRFFVVFPNPSIQTLGQARSVFSRIYFSSLLTVVQLFDALCFGD